MIILNSLRAPIIITHLLRSHRLGPTETTAESDLQEIDSNVVLAVGDGASLDN